MAPPGKTFDEPWQAQVLALVDAMVTRGRFTATEWAETLGGHLRQAEADGKPDTTDTYYQAALDALETLTKQHTAIDQPALDARKDQWARAYRATPHGEPVNLSAGEPDP